MKNAIQRIGTLIDAETKRDAVHFALLPAQAGHELLPGQPVGYDSTRRVASEHFSKHIGIVDPFLTSTVRPGEWFWIMLYPQTITSIRHVWTHPDIDEEKETLSENDESKKAVQVAQAEQAVRNWLDDRGGPDYEEFLSDIPTTGEFTSDYMVIRVDAYGDIPGEIWDHMEVVMDRKFKVRPTSFFCSC
jgi:hypothetical protein